MAQEQERLLTRLGYRFGSNGTHAARTMMLDELRLLLGHSAENASRADYSTSVVEQNVLGKPTRKSREITLRHLLSLYGLDASHNPVFRALRRLWHLDSHAQPILALAVALARDPLLRATQEFILGHPVGVSVERTAIERCLSQAYPERFSAASLKSFAQNVGGTWTAAGLLQGRARKVRIQPPVSPEAVSLLLFLGYLEGRTGQRLFSSSWTNLLGCPADELEANAKSAAHRGLIVFMNAGGVKEVRFPGFLTAEEEDIRRELLHVL